MPTSDIATELMPGGSQTEQSFGAHDAALLIWPGYDLGTCISQGDCSGGEWILAGIGVIPGGKGAAVGGKGLLKVLSRAPKALPAPRGLFPTPTAQNARLQGAINQLFREGDEIVGGAAGAVRHELATGTLVGGRSHVLKAQERVRQLQKIIRQESLSPADYATATRILDDLQDALGTIRIHP